MAVVTKSLARGSKQCEQSDGKSIQQPKPIPSVRRVDAHRSHPHAKAQVLRIAKPRLNSPAFSIGRHQLFGGIRCRACGQTPGFFHILGVDTDNGAYLIAISRNKSVAQGSRTSAYSNPVRCRACLTFGRGHGDIAAEPYEIYPVHVITRKSLGLMMRKLSVTESQSSAQFRGTFSRRKPSVASANWAQVA